ncbi:MAG: hypothetical protein HN877_00855 [Rhodospirillaceae bacterium]|nr:hypothetical protein [Rhodospirillaceae bacterium]
MAEDINQDEDDIEEEEEDRGAEAQQTLDDLTVLGDSSDHPDDPEEQGPGDDLSEWEEPSASQSLSVIHTGSRPTDAELLSNLIPEGEVIVEEGEIVRTDEEVGEPLDDVEPPAVELESPERDDPPAERDPEPAPAPQAEADEPAPPPAPDDEPVVEERDVDVQPAEPAAAAAPPPEVLPVDPPDEEEEEEEDDDDGDDDYPLETTDAEGGEDSAIALDIDPGDATEVTIANVPEGATLSAGTDNGDGTWTLTADQLDDLTITLPADSDVDFTLEVTAGDDTESLDVTVNAVADAPTATAEDVSGTEDNPIDLDLASVVTDVDLRDADGNPILDENGDIVRSESLSITIGGVPDGATLSVGTDNGDGTWTLTADDLTGLQINPPADFAGEIPLTLTSTSTEADGGDSATTEVPFTVTVADTVDVTAATTLEDTAVALDIDLPEGVGSVDIADIPDGAILMSGGQVIDVTNGSVTLTAEQLVDLNIQAPLDSDVDFTLQVTADGVTQDLDVTVIADVDKPTADGQDESGVAGSEIPLNLTAGLSDTDGSETLSIALGGIPDGAVLTSGGETITIDENGNADVSPDQLAGLQITPPADSDGDFQLTVTATSADGDDTATSTSTMDVSVATDADAPALNLADSAGSEDSAISLDISSGLTDTDGSETLSVTIGDIPAGSTLTSGFQTITVDENGNADIDPSQLAGLRITPPDDFSGSFDLTVTSTSTEENGGDTATTTGSITVDVEAVADDPTLSASDAAGTEDQAIALDIDAGVTDASESVSVTISGVPDGAALSAGTDNGDGSWTLDSGDLDGLTVTPPQDFSGNFDLTVTATTTEDDGDTSTTSGSLTVDVAEVDDSAEGSTLNVSDAAGTEDTAIDLDIGVTQLDTDGSETVSVTVSGVPDGASLNAGTDNGDGTWTLDSGDLDGLQLTPPADSNEDFSLGVSVTTTEANGGESTTTSGTIDVDLTGDSDGASLNVSLGSEGGEGGEGGSSSVTYDLDVSAALSDTDGSETLSITISDVPSGVTLDAGTDNGDGTWTLEAGDLDGLSMTVADGTPAFDLTVSATATEDDGDSSTTTATISVDATDTSADEAELSAADAVGSEDTAIALDIDAGLSDTDGSESLSITISGVPDGAALSAGADNGDGSWTLDADDLEGLSVTPPADSNEDFSLSVSATTTEASSGDTATTTTTLDVDVTGVADAPTLSVSIESAGQTSAETTIDVPEAISDAASGDDSVVVSGVPDGAFLNAGTDNGDGTWTLDSGDLDGLTVMPADGATDDISLSFEVPGSGAPGDSLVSENFDSGVSGWSGDAESSGGELRLEGDATTSKTFDFGPEHAGQTVTISFNADAQNDWEETGDYQDYFNVSGNGESVVSTSEGDAELHEFTVTLDENGQVTMEMSTDTTASDERVDIDNFQITAGDDWDSTPASADLDVTPETGGTIYDVDLVDIQTSLTDTDGSETLSVTVSGLPDGATLTAGTDNGDGTWTLDAGEVADLEMLVPAGSGDFDLTVSATATEDDGDTNTVTTTVTVVEPDTDADGATIETSDATGNEDTAIALDIDVTQVDTDGSETMSITISDVPTGANLSAGTDNGDGTWTLDAGDSDGLSVTPADDSSADFTLGISVTTTATSSGDTSTTTSTLDVDVAGVADAPTVSASTTFDSQESSETSVSVPQTITDAADTDGSTVTVSGVPNGASLSAGTDNGDGSWTLAADDLDSLTVTPAEGSSDDISLSFDVSGSGGPGDTVGSEDFSSGVSGWSGGMSANNGEMKIGGDNMDETASKTFDFGDEHAGQTVTVSFDVEMFGGWDESGGSRDYFQVSANDSQVINTTDDDQNSYSFEVTLDENGQVDLTFGADTTYSPEGVNIDNLSFTAGDDWDSSLASETVDVTPEAGGFNYDLDITAGLNDTDGSESLSITVSDMPNGATLSAGTDNGNGTWTLDAGDLDGLQVTVPTDAGEFDLSVSATATESDGDTNSVSTSVSISTPDTVAEDAALSTTDASGEEDRAIALEIDASLTDTDGSETLSISISGVPEGAELSSGTDNGDGSWTLDAGDLDGLTILPPTDSSADMSLTVTATTTETSTGDTSEVTSTMNVTVDGVADAPELSVSLGDGVEAGGGATPVSYWKMDENDNWADEGQTIADAMGNNNGAVGEDGQDLNDNGVFSKAAEFESGYGDHIEVPHDDSLKPESGALTMWFNADRTSGRNTLASSDSSGNDDGGHFGLFVENGTLRVRMQSEDDETDFTGGSVSTNEWNQVTVTWGEDGANVYLNGELVASDDDWTDGLAGNENPWTFGANQWSSGDNTANNLQDYFDGHMDGIAIYDEQLSSSDVQALFDDGVQDVMDSDEGGDSIQYPVDITAALADTDGSESMSISIEGIPDGAELSAGTDNGDGTWSVDEGDLDGLTLTVPADADDFAMSVSATVTDEGGDTRTVIETVEVDVSGDGFDAGTTGTSAGDTLTGSAGDDLISGQDGNDDISGGGGADTLLGGEGDDQIDGGDGNDVIDGGAGDDTIDSGAGDDNVMGGQGDDLFIFGSGDGADYFQGGDGWSDTVQLDDVSGGPGGDSGWTLQVDEGAGYTQTDSGIEFDAEASGVITLDDGSELTFDGVEKLEW